MAHTPKLASSSRRIPKGFRLKAQGCEQRATLGKGSRQRPTPTGLRREAGTGGRNPVGVGVSWRNSPRVARCSQPWAGGHNPFGIDPEATQATPWARQNAECRKAGQSHPKPPQSHILGIYSGVQRHLKATSKPPQSHLLGNQLGTQSHPKATPKPPQSHPKATLKPYTRHILRGTEAPQSHPKATSKPPQSHPKATLKPPQSHPKATPKPPQSHLDRAYQSLGGAETACFLGALAIAGSARAYFDTAASRRVHLPLLLWRRGRGRGGRHAGKLLLPSSAFAFVPLSPSLSPRSAGGEREKPPAAVLSCAQIPVFV